MNDSESMRIEQKAVRIEFDGRFSPTRLVVPLILPTGKHHDVRVRIQPREGLSLAHAVQLGDALQATFARSHSIGGGGSFFATASYERTFGETVKAYETVSLPDLRGVLFSLASYTVTRGPIAIQLAFPIVQYDPPSKPGDSVKITLEHGDAVLQEVSLSRETNPAASRVLILGDAGLPFANSSPLARGGGHWGPLLDLAPLQPLTLPGLDALLDHRVVGVHLYASVTEGAIRTADETIDAETFLGVLAAHDVKFVFISTCNSVRVVAAYRKAGLAALIAATENLAVRYANAFEMLFYRKLSQGAYISEAFRAASIVSEGSEARSMTMSGHYDPMFLDLRADVRLGVPHGT